MKKKLLGIALAFGLAVVLLAYLGCEKGRLAGGEKKKQHSGLLLWTQLDEGKWTQIKDVLKKKSDTPGASKRSKLFRLRRYDPPNDPVDEENGELDDAILVYDVADLDAQAKRDGFKGHAIQIGLGAIEDFQEIDSRKKDSPTPTPTPEETSTSGGTKMPQAHFRQNIIESRKMVKEINDILNPKSPGSPD